MFPRDDAFFVRAYAGSAAMKAQAITLSARLDIDLAPGARER